MDEKMKNLTTAAVDVYTDAMARVEANHPGVYARVEQLLSSGQATGRLELTAPAFSVRFVLTDVQTGHEEVLFVFDPVPDVAPLNVH